MTLPTDAPPWLRDILTDLARAQVRSEDRFAAVETQLATLVAAQTATEQRLDRLAAAQEETAAQLVRLTAAQERTEARLDQFAAITERRFAAVEQQLDQFAVTTERRFAAVEQRLDQQGEILAQHTEMLAQHGDQLGRIEQRLDQHGDRLGALTGWALEGHVRDHAPSYFDTLADRLRVLTPAALDAALDPAVAAGRLTRADAAEIRRADLVCSGTDPQSGAALFLLVEVSARVAVRDVEPAASRAGLLARLGVPVIPVVVGQRIDHDAQTAAETAGVRQISAESE